MDDIKQFLEQRKLADEYCFTNRIPKNKLNLFLEHSEQKETLIKDWDTEIVTQILELNQSFHGFVNAKSLLTAFCKYAGYEGTLEALSQVTYVDTIRYYLSFGAMRDEIQSNIEAINPYDIRQYDNLVIVAYLIAMGLTPKEIAELKKTDYQNGIISINGKNYTCPDDFLSLLSKYYLTDSYVVQCTTKLKTIYYRDTDYFLKSTAKSHMSLKTIYLYTKKLPIICNGRGVFEIQQSKIMWDLFLEYGYDLENPNVLKNTDWESVKKNVKSCIPVVDIDIVAIARNAFLDILIQYRNRAN